MTVNQKIRSALERFGLPISENFFGDGDEEYLTFNIPSDKAVVHGDDTPIHDTASVQIHWFLPVEKNYLEGKKQIRKALHNSGSTYPEVEVLVEPGNKIRHVIFTCEIENDEELEE